MPSVVQRADATTATTTEVSGGLGTIVADGPVAGDAGGALGSYDLFALADGVMTRITHNTAEQDGFTPSSSSPSLSPDGTQVVYQRCVRATFTGGMRRHSSDAFPSCSPHIMNVDGTGDRGLTTPEANSAPVTLSDYEWGPSAVAFTNGEGVLYRLDPASGSATVISNSSSQFWYNPSWSADGTELVVEGRRRDSSGDPTGNADIWKIGVDGSNPTRITNTPDGWEMSPVWSPDGADVMFEESDPTNFEFCVKMMAQDGSDPACVETLNNYSDQTTGAWSKDSLYLGLRFVDPNDSDSDWFGFVPRDGSVSTLTKAVELPDQVTAVDWFGDADLPPIADDQSLTVPGNGSAGVTLTAHDPDSDPITYTVLTQPKHGTLTGTPPTLTYDAAQGYEGDDSFTFQVTANGMKSNVATVSITVTKPCTIIGTNGHDVLHGTEGPDVICGLGSNDVLFGNGGDDFLYGGAGDDDLAGGAGNDVLDGGADDDAVRGDEGSDQLIGGQGSDLVSYLSAKSGATVDLSAQSGHAPGMGADSLSGIENAFGTGYNDVLEGDGGDNQLFGGSGDDRLVGRRGSDLLNGRTGKDSLSGGAGADALYGGAGIDSLGGGSGPDACYTDADGGSRKGCENQDDGGKQRLTPSPGATGKLPARRMSDPGQVQSWYIGDNDYLILFDVTASQYASYDAQGRDKARWENNMCFYLAKTPAAGACDGAKLNTIWKVVFREWQSYRAALVGGCLPVVLDYGRHASYGFRKKWKLRTGDNYYSHTAQLWTTLGDTDSIATSNAGDVGGAEYVDVKCTL